MKMIIMFILSLFYVHIIIKQHLSLNSCAMLGIAKILKTNKMLSVVTSGGRMLMLFDR